MGRGERSSYGTVMAICVVAGLAYLVIGLATGQGGFGVAGLVIMLGYALVLTLWRRRSETAALLAGESTDERRRDITVRAGAFMGNVLLVAIVAAFLVSLATRSDLAMVFAWLAALGAVAFGGALAWFSRRG